MANRDLADSRQEKCESLQAIEEPTKGRVSVYQHFSGDDCTIWLAFCLSAGVVACEFAGGFPINRARWAKCINSELFQLFTIAIKSLHCACSKYTDQLHHQSYRRTFPPTNLWTQEPSASNLGTILLDPPARLG